jgi:cell wall-associated NlpC family hydrolase
MREGDTTLALINLALTGLGKLATPEEAARRLSMADGLMATGVDPGYILRALGLELESLGDPMLKYDPDQPRVPAGNGDTSGQWTGDQPPEDGKSSTTSAWSKFLNYFSLIGSAEAAESQPSPTARLKTAMRLAEEGRLPPPGPWATEAENLGTHTGLTAQNGAIDSPASQRIRAAIVSAAIAYEGSMNWAQATDYGLFGEGKDKCNLFVHDVLAEAGADPGEPNQGWINNSPPTAGQWANPNFPITQWSVLVPGETPLPGDVVAQGANYSNASGHVAIVVDNGYIIGTHSTQGDDSGIIMSVPDRPIIVDPGTQTGAKVYRRYRP